MREMLLSSCPLPGSLCLDSVSQTSRINYWERRPGAMVRWCFKVLVRPTKTSYEVLDARGSHPLRAAAHACFRSHARCFSAPSDSLAGRCSAQISSADRLPCPRASRRTADLSVCCLSARSPPNTTRVGLAAPRRSRFPASVEVPRPPLFFRRGGLYPLDVPRLFCGVPGQMFLLAKKNVRFAASIPSYRLQPQLADPTGVETRLRFVSAARSLQRLLF